MTKSSPGSGRLSSLAAGNPPGCSQLIVIAAAGFLAIGLACYFVWRWTGNDQWVTGFFNFPGAILLTCLAASEVYLSLLVFREFSVGQPMRTAWALIAVSAVFDLVGAVSVQILSINSYLNPLPYLGWWSETTAASIRAFGLALGGPFRFTMLAAGLAKVLRVYRQSRLQSRLKILDRILLLLVAGYILLQARDVAAMLRKGGHPSLSVVVSWPTDPVLWLLLGQALLLYRSVQQMGGGYIGRCWKAFSVGIFLISLGDIAQWATVWGFLPYPWSGLAWYIWLPAAGAFALAPAYQLEAMYFARMAHRGDPPIAQPT